MYYIFSINNLLALPISVFAGFISLHFGIDLKLSLWSFRVINAFVFAKQYTLTPIWNSWLITLPSLLILLYASLFVSGIYIYIYIYIIYMLYLSIYRYVYIYICIYIDIYIYINLIQRVFNTTWLILLVSCQAIFSQYFYLQKKKRFYK